LSKTWNTLPGEDDISRFHLSNGITVLTRSNFNSPSVVISGYLESGSLFDIPDKMGLANFTAQSLMRGTQKKDIQQIFDLLESAGASLGVAANVHTAGFGGMSLAEDLPLLLSQLAESLRLPVFPPEQVERLRTQQLTSIAIRDQDTGDQASMHFEKILFASHPYGNPEDGYAETIQSITRQDLIDFHRLHYGPRGMVLVVVGAISPSALKDLAEQTLGDWQNEEQMELPTLPEVVPVETFVRKHVVIPGKTQTDLVMGTLGPSRTSTDYLPASLGNHILGQFGMMGRIGDVVRERAGLAYYASTSLNAYAETGSWEVSAGVNPSNLDRAIELIIEELRRFTNELVTAEELEDSKANLIGRLPLSLESNAGVANAILRLERFQLGLNYYRQYPDLIQQVQREEILEIARRYQDLKRMVVVSAGPG